MTRISDEGLALLISKVTLTMARMGFLAAPCRIGRRPIGRTALVALGDGAWTVGLSCDRLSLERLCAALLVGTGLQADEALRDDALRELANMTAGQIKGVLCPDKTLGLPRLMDGAPPPDGSWRRVCLHSDDVEVVLWLKKSKGTDWEPVT
ncbi:MAG TPA: hypothetical protein VKE22_28465 [Haliangiales bacterium]|nr:hypothetical protein [Haliangiales bacterium]